MICVLQKHRETNYAHPTTILSHIGDHIGGQCAFYVTRQSRDASDTNLARDPANCSFTEPNQASAGGLANATVDNAQKKIPVNPLIGRVLDWNKYPGTLDSQIHRALDSHNGEMALDIAAKLWKCKFVAGMLIRRMHRRSRHRKIWRCRNQA
jgi:hypothetical protein